MLDKGRLTEFSIFSDVPQDKLSAIAQTGDLVEFKPQEVIFHQDEAAGNLYGVLDGEVELILIFKGEVFKSTHFPEPNILARKADRNRHGRPW